MEPRKHLKPITTASLLLLTTLTLLFASGCYPAYSPPVRTGHYGAPAAPKPGQLEVGGAFLANSEAEGGGGFLDYSVSDQVQLEAGADALSETLVMGFLGVRWAPLNPVFAANRVKFTLDIEGGGGAGVGGEDCREEGHPELGGETCDNINWKNRPAGGGYLGLGLGLKVGLFDLFARGRLQLTKAQSAPLTMWSTALLGSQWTIARRLKLYVGAGAFRFDDQDNPHNSEDGFLFESGLSLLFDTMPTAPPNPSTTP